MAQVPFLLTLAKTQTLINNTLDRGYLGGLTFSEFLLLYYLDLAPGQKLKRVDLARKVGLTPSGVTRLLLPMEKVHLVKSDASVDDARVRYVTITPAGKEKLAESKERLELFAEEILPKRKASECAEFARLLNEIETKLYLR